MKLKPLGRVAYPVTFAAMQAHTEARTPDTPDELWWCEHDPVYTQGLAGRAEHLLNPQGIPVVQSNRGGQVTYHGPGQVVAYPLVDLRRLNIFVKEYVFRLEAALIRTLADFGVTGHRVAGAPGIYVRLDDPRGHATLEPGRRAAPGRAPPLGAPAPGGDPFRGLGKVAALGIKVSRHCAYHGLALNVAMDLAPFAGINPCGYSGLRTVDLRSLGVDVAWDDAAHRLAGHLDALLSA